MRTEAPGPAVAAAAQDDPASAALYTALEPAARPLKPASSPNALAVDPMAAGIRREAHQPGRLVRGDR